MTSRLRRGLRIVAFVCSAATATAVSAQSVDGFDPGANGQVEAMAIQADGKILVGGTFSLLGGGGTGVTPRTRLARLNVDGSVDGSFSPGASSGNVLALAVQTDGKIVVAGAFTLLSGATRNNIGRLNADGSIDTSFNPGTAGGTAGSSEVDALAIQPDGKILVGGEFTSLGGILRNHLGRLNADGSVDSGFNPNVGSSTGDAVISLAVQPDLKIVVGGVFATVGGATPRKGIARLNANGTVDTAFNPGANGFVITAVALQGDGKILLGGDFTALGGGSGTTPRSKIGRLNADGTVDGAFDPGASGAQSIVYSISVQADGKILVGGNFTTLGNSGTVPRRYIGRVGPDGSIDAGFDPGANATVAGLLVQPDGSILLGGSFTALGGGTGTTPRSRIGRVTNPDAAIQRLRLMGNGSVVSLVRGGAAPEVSRVTFESSSNGVTFTPLGAVTRVVGGWQLAGQSLPANQVFYIRARGFYQDGYENASGSIVEMIRNVFAPPTLGALGSVVAAPNAPPIAVAVTVGGGVDGPAGVLVAASSSNQSLVPNANLVLGGSGAARTLAITLAPNRAGTAVITVTGTDGDLTATRSFVLRVGGGTGDFDGDGKADVTVFRPSTGIWYVRNIVTGLFEFYQWGLSGDIPVPGDYDGDGRNDIAVWRPSTGIWYIRNSSNGASAFLQWGLTGDIPVPGDYDGDGKADAAVFRPSTGIWYVRDLATNTASFYQWGLSGDSPVPADYDGDGKTDVAVWRPSTGIWYIRNSTNGSSAFLQWGLSGDIAVPGDYDGDGKADSAVFRPSTGIWYVRDLVTNTALFYQWGLSGDVPVPADFDGDGKTDVAVFRPSTSIWYVRPSSTPGAPGFYQWGASGDVPVLKQP